jgi:hypothetical protein
MGFVIIYRMGRFDSLKNELLCKKQFLISQLVRLHRPVAPTDWALFLFARMGFQRFQALSGH